MTDRHTENSQTPEMDELGDSFDLHDQPKILVAPARILAIAGGAVLLIMMFHIVLDVFLKYAFNYPIQGTMEIVASYYMVAIVMLPLMAVSLGNSHIFVEFFTKFLSPRKLSMLLFFVHLFSFLAILFLFYASVDQAIRKTIAGEAWETADGAIDIWYSRWLVPVGIGFCSVAFGRLTWQAFNSLRSLRKQ